MQLGRRTAEVTSRDDRSSARRSFDRAAPLRRSIRCGSVRDRLDRQSVQRSQSTQSMNRVNSLPNCVGSEWTVSPAIIQIDPTPTAQTEAGTGNRFRKRLDVIRSNLVARLTRQRKDSDRTKADVRREVASERQLETKSNGAVIPSAAPTSALAKKPFDRRRVQRRTPRRHRTVVFNDQVSMHPIGTLRRHASSGARMAELRHQDDDDDDDDIQCRLSSKFGSDSRLDAGTNDDEKMFTDTNRHDKFQQLLASRIDSTDADGDSGGSSASTVVFEVVLDRGPDGARKLGFTVVGGCDSPRGPMGVYIKTIFPGGLADENKLREGDEIVEVNGTELAPVTHSQAVAIFKRIRRGRTLILIRRRHHPRLISDNGSSITVDSTSLRTLSAGDGEPITFDASSRLHGADNKTELTAASEGDAAATAIAGLDDRCRAQALGRPWKQLSPCHRSRQGDVYWYPAVLGHVTSPTSWKNRFLRSPAATRQDDAFQFQLTRPTWRQLSAAPRPEVMWCWRRHENRVNVGLMTNVSAHDDVVQVSPSVCSVSYDSTLISARNGNKIMSFPNTNTLPCDTAISQLCVQKFRRYTLEVDLSGHSTTASLVEGSLTGSFPVSRNWTSCCELSAVATDAPMSAGAAFPSPVTSTSTQLQTTQLSSGEEFPTLLCRSSETGTSYAPVSATASSSLSRPLSADDKCLGLQDSNEMVNSEDNGTMQRGWPTSEQTELNPAKSGRMVPEYFDDVDVGHIKDDIKSSSSYRGRQIIYV